MNANAKMKLNIIWLIYLLVVAVMLIGLKRIIALEKGDLSVWIVGLCTTVIPMSLILLKLTRVMAKNINYGYTKWRDIQPFRDAHHCCCHKKENFDPFTDPGCADMEGNIFHE